jgi:hypothetical protein
MLLPNQRSPAQEEDGNWDEMDGIFTGTSARAWPEMLGLI